MRRIALPLFCLLGYCPRLCAQEASVQPLRVCDIARDPASYTGKTVAVVGRYSFRQTGRFLSEDHCGAGSNGPVIIPLSFDQHLAPKTPEHLDISAASVAALLKIIRQNTALTKFRFGTPDYDRWAVVYGRIDQGKLLKPVSLSTGSAAMEAAPVELIVAGDSVVMFLVDRY